MSGSDPLPAVVASADTAPAVVLLVLTGATLVGVALAALKPESRLRRAAGVPVDDDAATRSNAAVLAAVGAGVLLLAWAIAAGVSDRIVGVGTVLAGAGACFVLGWLVRYRGRHELLTVRDPDPTTARRLGGAVLICGAFVLPLAPALWIGAGDALVVLIASAGSLSSLAAMAVAAR